MTPRERRLWIATAVSLALNLVLLGFFIGRGFGHRHGPPPAGPFHAREVFDFDSSPELRSRFERRKEQLRPTHQALRKARRELEAALLAEPYDRPRVEKALQALREETAKLQLGMHEALLDMAGNLDPEHRRAFVRDNFDGKKRPRPPRRD